MGKQGKAMRWTLRIAAVLAVLLLAYAIWPVVGFARIASAIEQGLGDYYIYLPPGKAPDKQFKVKLSLKEMQWKLAGIDLPQPMRIELAQQLIKQRTEKSE